jgi:hypothetical protein
LNNQNFNNRPSEQPDEVEGEVVLGGYTCPPGASTISSNSAKWSFDTAFKILALAGFEKQI